MKILLHTDSNDPDYTADCDCAVLEITPELLQQIIRRIEIAERAAAADGDLSEVHFRDPGPEHYRYDLVEACAESAARSAEADRFSLCKLDAEGYQVIPHSVDLELFEPRGTECSHLIIRLGQEPEISWRARPKGSDIRVTTWPVPLAQLEAFITASGHR